jgi:tetratricopeptide (TPR) repeat protein
LKYTKVREMFFYLLSCFVPKQIGLVQPDASEAQCGATSVCIASAMRSVALNGFFENNNTFITPAILVRCQAFESNLAEARRFQAKDPEQAISHLEKAMQHYRGEFLEGWNSGEWHFQRRQELEREYLNVLLTLGQLHFAQAHYAQAADAYLRAIATDSYLETAHRELIRCYARLGECGQALRHYQELVELLRDEVGTLPSPETQALYAQLQRGKSI